ncbi:uncharacterized protein LOC123307003 [Coccinella septempunctata]|uniref:uncharacterized protein LOC123307003 n=1 Tax=Coccinella septempunctata TaxID=41139 RepID=UPI001D071114|nr:uncharacterized protein LOC123307003 [Coccinella septempunctata]
METGTKELVICSAYFPGDTTFPPPNEVRKLVAFCRGKNLQLLVACDANSHHTTWGSTDINERDLERLANSIGQAIVSAYHENCPLRKKSDNRKVSWWNSKLEKLRKEVRKKFNRAKSAGEWEVYRQILTLYNKEVRKAKRESWENFCSSIEDAASGTRLHKILSREPSLTLGSVKRSDGTYTASGAETLKIMADTHFPDHVLIDSASAEEGNFTSRLKRPSKECWKFVNKLVTASVVRRAVLSFLPYKAPGDDEIFPALLQHGLEFLMSYLIRLFRSSLAWNFIPSNWRKVKVVYIPKAGKTDSQPKSFE